MLKSLDKRFSIRNSYRAFVTLLMFCVGCQQLQSFSLFGGEYPTPTYSGLPRSFTSSFESASDFSGFYTEKGDAFASAQKFSTEQVKEGRYSHKAWILKARDQNNDSTIFNYRPHRAYPTIQFQKTPQGIFRTPCLITLWVYLDTKLDPKPRGHISDWFSFATLTPDVTNGWNRVVVANISSTGYLRLVHVPKQGQQIHLYQADALNDPNGSLKFPYQQWVRMDLLIDFNQSSGYAKLWQNGILVSHALVEGGSGGLSQAHFGLYAAAAVASCTIYNDKLRIIEIKDEREALSLIKSEW